MSSTGQKAHRRTLSLNQGNNSSSEDLLAVPTQRVETARPQPQYLSPIDTKPPKTSASNNNHLSVIPESVPPLLTPPPTPSKQKPYRRRKSTDNLRLSQVTVSLYSIKNILFTIVFCAALIVFLGSLSGIGPIDDELHNVSTKEQEYTANLDDSVVHSHDVNDQSHSAIEEEPALNSEKELWNTIQPGQNNWENELNYHEQTESDNRIQDNNLDIQREYETHVDGDNVDDHEQHIGEDFFQHHEDDFLENHFDSSPATASIHNAQPTPDGLEHMHNDNGDVSFGHTDELLANNGDQPVSSEEKDNVEDQYSSSNKVIVGLPNKLKQKPKQDSTFNEKIPLDSPSSDLNAGENDEKEDNWIDYSNYTYISPEPHFTYMDVVKSLDEEDRLKLSEIQERKMITDESLDPACGKWQESYTKLHKDIIAGNKPQRYISYICDASTNCGGLADRILGMTSTFIFALLTNRAFTAEWQVPLPLDAIFNSPNIDWAYDSRNSESLFKDLEVKELDVTNFNGQHLDRLFLHSNWTLKYPEPLIKFRTNRGMVMRTFNSKIYAPQLKEMSLRPHMALGCFLDYLFRPTPSALSFITEYTSLFSLPNVFSVGIQIRTGEKSNAQDSDLSNQKQMLQHYKDFFLCADGLVQTYAGADQKVIYFLITDSEKLRDEAIEKLDNVIISGLPIDPNHRRKGHADGVHNAIIENWILSQTNYRVISPGGYGKLSAFHSKTLHSTIAIYPPGLDSVHDIYHRQVPDCTREDAFTTFRELANEWSLG